jgi:hypothetical protein
MLLSPDADQHTVPVVTDRRTTALARARRYLPGLVGVGILVSLIVNCARPLTNTDTYFHLRFGEEFLSGWSLRDPGSVSTFATQHWVPTQWLSEVVMARTEQWFGLSGLAFLSGVLELVLFVVLYAAARDRAEPLVVLPLTAMGLYAMESGLSMRPQVVSYAMVALVTAAWLRTQRDGRVRWWLVPLVYVWAMLHGMWPVALVIGLVVCVGFTLDRVPSRLLLRSLLVTALSAVVAALTPVGPALYGAEVAVGSRASFFAEWSAPDFTTGSCLTLAVLMTVTAAAMWRRGQNSWTEVALVVLAAGFGVYSLRTVPVAAAMLVPLAAAPVQDLLRAPRAPVRRREVGALAGGLAATLAVLALAVPHTSSEPLSEPAWLDPAVARLPAGTKVLDDWSLGGYLMWRYPKLDLMMHGYGDTFTTQELTDNTSLIELDPGWDSVLRSSGTRVALLRPSDRLSYALINQFHWRVERTSPDLFLLRAPRSWVSESGPVASMP